MFEVSFLRFRYCLAISHVRLIGDKSKPVWNGRPHFYRAAAEAMRRILIEDARRKLRLKHGGGIKRVSMDLFDLADHETPEFAIVLHEAIDLLADEEPIVAKVVCLRYFAGLTNEEVANCLGHATRTVTRHWAYAKAWLYQHLVDAE